MDRGLGEVHSTEPGLCLEALRASLHIFAAHITALAIGAKRFFGTFQTQKVSQRVPRTIVLSRE